MWSDSHASQGTKDAADRRGYASLDQAQDSRGYDFLKTDVYTSAKKPLDLSVEIRDAGTRDYWTRVNYTTVVTPREEHAGHPREATLRGREIPAGTAARPRPGQPAGLRHRRFSPRLLSSWMTCGWSETTRPAARRFEGLHAFDFGTGTSPVMEGFTHITPATVYSRGRGYGLEGLRGCGGAFDALQPDPLYQDFLCIESGGLALDVPNGTLPCLRQYRLPVRLLGRVPGLPEEDLILAEGGRS